MHNLNDYVSGERIAALADVKWKRGDPLENRNMVVYTSTYEIADLFDKIRRNSAYYVVITHNSDVNIDQALYEQKPPNVVLWFSQNVCHKADDLIAVPIGIANSEWPHGNVDDIIATSIPPTTPEYSFQFCVKIDTNPRERPKWVDFVNKYRSQVICPPYPCDRHTFLTTISQAICVLSPAGNGVDCHRNYETFLMGRYPVTNYNVGLDSLPLPFVFVHDINEETPTSIGEKLQRAVERPRDYSVLFMPYWQTQIQNARNLLFSCSLKQASEIVSTWPEWKQRILNGNT